MTDHKALENVLLGVAYLHPMKILHVIKNFRSNDMPTPARRTRFYLLAVGPTRNFVHPMMIYDVV